MKILHALSYLLFLTNVLVAAHVENKADSIQEGNSYVSLFPPEIRLKDTPISYLELSPDGTKILAGDAYGLLIDFETLNVISKLDPTTPNEHYLGPVVSTYGFSADGSKIYVIKDFYAYTFDATTGKDLLSSFYIGTLGVSNQKRVPFAHSLQGTKIAIALDSNLKIIDIRHCVDKHESCGLEHRFHQNSIRSISFLPNSSLIISAEDKGYTFVYNFETKKIIKTFSTGAIEQIKVSKNGKLLYALQKDLFTVWDIDSGKEITSFGSSGDVGPRYYSQMSVSPDGTIAALMRHDEIYLYDIGWGKPIELLSNKYKNIQPSSLSFTPDGRFLVVGTSLGEIYKIEIAGMKIISRL